MSESERTIEYEGTRYTHNSGETVLKALLRQGVNLAYSCGKGSCHSCILRLTEGQVDSSHSVDAALTESGHFLPCIAHAKQPIVVAPPDLSALTKPAEIVDRRLLTDDILELDIAPMSTLAFEAGQHVHLIDKARDLSRPYSIVSQPEEDYFFRVHVRKIAGGAMSEWLFEHAQPGTALEVRGPLGTCFYEPKMQGRPLLLLATGTGLGALVGVVRAALAAGHTAPITLYHGGRRRPDLYLHQELVALAAAHEGFRYVPCLSQEPGDDEVRHGRVCAHAFAEHPELASYELFLCGLPAMVEEARHRAVLAGADRDSIHVDPFDFQHPRLPQDAEKIKEFAADPELWAALREGAGLTEVLTEFYARLFQDARLVPFFHGLTPQQVAEKQYGFLADLISGTRNYFGLNPFNAHHWMVISDELFDYRERLFEAVLRDHGLTPELIRRFLALHERFRPEIVKSAPRAMRTKDGEIPYVTQSTERIDLDAMCDECGAEIPAGSMVRYLHRLGHLHCSACAGL